MSQAIATRGNVSGLPALPPLEPRLSPTLGGLVRKVLDPHHSEVGKPIEAMQFARDEAARAVEFYDRIARPAGPDVVRRWLMQVNAGAAAPLGETDFRLRAIAIASLVADLPLAVFHGGTLREAQIAFKFFPGAAEVHALLNPHAQPILARASALRRIAQSGPSEHRGPPGADEIAYVAGLLARHRQELAQAQIDRDALLPKATPLRDVSLKGEALRLSRERRGIVAGEGA